MHRDGRYGPCRSLSPPLWSSSQYKRCGGRCQVCLGCYVAESGQYGRSRAGLRIHDHKKLVPARR